MLHAFTDFPKNAIDVGIASRVQGRRESHSRKNCWTAQNALVNPADPTIPTVVASLGSYKACVRSDHTVPSGVLFKASTSPEASWSANHPLHFS